MDWKEALLAQSRAMGIEPEHQTGDQAPEPEKQPEQIQKEAVNIVMERKGRGGKTATIIEGFTCSDEVLRQTAAALKSALGTGGSARGGEILIQGDRREDAGRWLRAKGYKVKGIKG